MRTGAAIAFRLALAAGVLALAALPATCPQHAAENPDTVLVLYSTRCPDYDKDGVNDSEEIARYYAERRHIPADHLLGIRPPDGGPYDRYWAWSYADFQARVIGPLKQKLDALGRERILYLVTTFGLPARIQTTAGNQIAADASMACPFQFANESPNVRRFYEIPPGNRYGAPHFDSVRAREEKGSYDPNGIGYLVTRIDGVGVPACKALIDGAIYADTYKVDGYGYLDERLGQDYSDADLRTWARTGSYGTTQEVDKAIASCRLAFRAAKIPVREQRDYEEIGTVKDGGLKYSDGTSALDAPRALLYAGWYNYGKYKGVWDWLPGSVALDFDSASLFAHTTFMGSFDGMALFNGASGAVGCFAEPYTTGHPQPDVLMTSYTRGYNFAEAAWLSMPNKPFVNFAIGDPLMNPYGHNRAPNTGITPPTVTLKKDGDTLRARVRMQGYAEIARARMVVADRKDDSLLPPATRHDGRFQREHNLGAPLPKAGPVWAGIVCTDPAGNTARVWTEWKG